jgi:hypothetical protein
MAECLRNEKYTEQGLILKTDSEEAISSESDSGHDKDAAALTGYDSNVRQSQVHTWSKLQQPWNSGDVQPFTGCPSALRTQKVPSSEQGFYTHYHLFLLHRSDAAISGRD